MLNSEEIYIIHKEIIDLMIYEVSSFIYLHYHLYLHHLKFKYYQYKNIHNALSRKKFIGHLIYKLLI